MWEVCYSRWQVKYDRSNMLRVCEEKVWACVGGVEMFVRCQAVEGVPNEGLQVMHRVTPSPCTWLPDVDRGVLVIALLHEHERS